MSFNFMAAVTIAVILEPDKKKICQFSFFPHLFCHEVMGPVSFKADFSLYSFTFIKSLFIASLLSAITVVFSAYL